MIRGTFFCSVVLLMLATTASATFMGPNDGPITAADLVLAAPVGTLKVQTGVIAVNSGTFHANVQEQVWQESGGTLDFYYQIRNVSGDGNGRITLSSYAGFTTDVGYAEFNLPGMTGAVQPSYQRRGNDGSTVGFEFGGASGLKGATSYVLAIKTNATVYQGGNVSVIDEQSANSSSFYAPGPEPASIFFLGTALLGVSLIAKRKLASRR